MLWNQKSQLSHLTHLIETFLFLGGDFSPHFLQVDVSAVFLLLLFLVCLLSGALFPSVLGKTPTAPATGFGMTSAADPSIPVAVRLLLGTGI